MYLGNIALLVMNLPMVPLFAKLLNTPYMVLYPGILLISVVGVYSVNFSLFDVWLLVIFGLLGYVMRKLDIPAAPLVLAFVLGPIAENAVRQSLLLSDGSLGIYLDRPISAAFLGLAALLLATLMFGRSRKVREQVLEVDD
jgi:putative tricarboxylic transport membrane protein